MRKIYWRVKTEDGQMRRLMNYEILQNNNGEDNVKFTKARRVGGYGHIYSKENTLRKAMYTSCRQRFKDHEYYESEKKVKNRQ